MPSFCDDFFFSFWSTLLKSSLVRNSGLKTSFFFSVWKYPSGLFWGDRFANYKTLGREEIPFSSLDALGLPYLPLLPWQPRSAAIFVLFVNSISLRLFYVFLFLFLLFVLAQHQRALPTKNYFKIPSCLVVEGPWLHIEASYSAIAHPGGWILTWEGFSFYPGPPSGRTHFLSDSRSGVVLFSVLSIEGLSLGDTQEDPGPVQIFLYGFSKKSCRTPPRLLTPSGALFLFVFTASENFLYFLANSVMH